MKNTLKNTTLLTFLTLCMVALFAVGCGDSEEFVATGPVVAPGTGGNLSFAFDRALAQTAGQVPAATTQLIFSLHSGNPPTQANLVETRLVAFNESIVLEDVDPSVTTVVVLALSSEQFPLVTLQGDAVVVVGTTQPVDLAGATIITYDALTVAPQLVNVVKDAAGVQLDLTLAFSNGSTFNLVNFDAPEFSSSQNNVVANITPTGLVSTGVGGQNATGTAFYDLFGTSHSDTFEIHTYCFEIFSYDTPNIAGSGGPFTDTLEMSGRFVGPNGIVDNINHNGGNANPNLSFALATPVTGVSIDPNSGDLTGTNVSNGTQIDILVTYTDPNTGFAVTLPQTVFAADE
jgi:hypothetical protein